VFISRRKLREMKCRIDSLESTSQFQHDHYWELWHKINHIHAYLGVELITTPETTTLVKRGEKK